MPKFVFSIEDVDADPSEFIFEGKTVKDLVDWLCDFPEINLYLGETNYKMMDNILLHEFGIIPDDVDSMLSEKIPVDTIKMVYPEDIEMIDKVLEEMYKAEDLQDINRS